MMNFMGSYFLCSFNMPNISRYSFCLGHSGAEMSLKTSFIMLQEGKKKVPYKDGITLVQKYQRDAPVQ